MEEQSNEVKTEWSIPKIVALSTLKKMNEDPLFSDTESNTGIFDFIRAASCFPGRTVKSDRCVNGTHP